MADKIIRDPINGNIRVNELEISLIDTPHYQRLRRITQLGFAYLAYPCAYHTRFDHSLGAMHMAGRMCDAVGATAEQRQAARITALLHDLGHPPFSHDLATFMEKQCGKSHEDVTIEIIRDTELHDKIEAGGQDPNQIAMLAGGSGHGWLQMITTGREASYLRTCIDADILDYMIRDSYYTGVAYGLIDRDRLIDSLAIHNDRLVIHEKARLAVESLLLARYIMMPVVYRHKVAGIAEAMMTHALERLHTEAPFDAEALYHMDEVDFISMMRATSGYPREITRRLDERDLFKTAAVARLCRARCKKSTCKNCTERHEDEIDLETTSKLLSLRKEDGKIEEIERELAKECGVEEGYLLLDIYPEPARSVDAPPLDSIMIFDGEKSRGIESISPVANSIAVMDWGLWYSAIYTTRDARERLRKKFRQERVFETIAQTY